MVAVDRVIKFVQFYFCDVQSSSLRVVAKSVKACLHDVLSEDPAEPQRVQVGLEVESFVFLVVLDGQECSRLLYVFDLLLIRRIHSHIRSYQLVVQLMRVLSLEQLETTGGHQCVRPRPPVMKALLDDHLVPLLNEPLQPLLLLAIKPDQLFPDLHGSFKIEFARSLAQEFDDSE